MSIRTLLPLLAALIILTIPASEASTGTTDKVKRTHTDKTTYYKPYHSWYKYRCYVPGCDSCEAYDPYTCTKCAVGYAPLADGTCGCAAGYGSFIDPKVAVANFPYNKPMCPKIKSGKSTWATRTSTGKTTWVDTKTYYYNKPSICKYKYYADNKCQDSPKPGYGYCGCSPCPAGYTSAGNTTIAESKCVPIGGGGGGGTTTGRCKGQPPAVENASPWRKPCNNKKEGLSCYIGCKVGFKPSPRVIASCTKGGIWSVSGQCVATTGGPACPGVPEVGADAGQWSADCTDGAAGKTCTAACADGFEGEATATCLPGGAGWSVDSTCVASGGGGGGGEPLCPGTPDVSFDENALPFEDCADGNLEDGCQTFCADGFLGGYDALCTEDGWDVQGECTADYGGGDYGEVVCAGEPPAIEDGSVTTPWAEGDGFCADGVLDDTCDVSCADGYDGYASAYCTEAGWEVDNQCVPLRRNKF